MDKSEIDKVIAKNLPVNQNLPTPRVVETEDDVINLDVPFTLEMPTVPTARYTHVILMFVNADGSCVPQTGFIERLWQSITRVSVDNKDIYPPFNRDHEAVVQGYLKEDGGEWQRTPDSRIYTFA